MKNYYQILGVPASATKDEIKEAYLKLSKKIHPDMNKGDNFFTELFKNINEAHQVLIDDEKRSEYNLKFNSYLYDFNFMKEKEFELKRREDALVDKYIRRKIFIRNTVSLIAGISIVALFSFNLDKSSDREAIAESNVRPLKQIAMVKPVQSTQTSLDKEVSTIKIKNQVPSPIEGSQLHEENLVQNKPETKPTLTASVQIAKSEMPIIKQKIDEIKKHTVSNKPVLLSDYNMNKIVVSIMKERLKRSNPSNVVKLIKYAGSNVDNAFKLANVLRSNGFILAGRETTYKSSKGIQIDCNGDIIKITIGSI